MAHKPISALDSSQTGSQTPNAKRQTTSTPHTNTKHQAQAQAQAPSTKHKKHKQHKHQEVRRLSHDFRLLASFSLNLNLNRIIAHPIPSPIAPKPKRSRPSPARCFLHLLLLLGSRKPLGEPGPGGGCPLGCGWSWRLEALGEARGPRGWGVRPAPSAQARQLLLLHQPCCLREARV